MLVRARLPGARSHLYRRTAALRLDSDRADSGQPLGHRRHGRVALHSGYRCRDRRCGRSGRRVTVFRKPGEASRRKRSRTSASSIWNARACTERLRRPFFIDKDPGNHFHVGLIALILPNAKIIDARRNPAAACWSQFTLQFKMTNLRLTEYARAWRDYAELMAHFDAVLPGKVHRVIYENLVGRYRRRSAPPAGLSGAAVRRELLALLRNRARRADAELRTGAPPDHPRSRRAWRHFEPGSAPC